MHYLDDAFGVHRLHLVHEQYELAGKTLKKSCLSTKESKDEPPNTTQKILSSEHVTMKMKVRIPSDKLMNTACTSLLQRPQVTKRQLFSLTGK